MQVPIISGQKSSLQVWLIFLRKQARFILKIFYFGLEIAAKNPVLTPKFGLILDAIAQIISRAIALFKFYIILQIIPYPRLV